MKNVALTQGYKIELCPNARTCSGEPRIRSVLLTLTGAEMNKTEQLRWRGERRGSGAAASYSGGAYGKINSDELALAVRRSLQSTVMYSAWK